MTGGGAASRLAQLLLGFHGRISRKSWWIGILILFAVDLVIGLILSPQDYGLDYQPVQAPDWIDGLLELLLLVPTIALIVKRMNDRDRPVWLGYLFGALCVVQILGFRGGYFSEHISIPELIFLIVFLLFGFFTLIDNALFRGTKGPNRYGPDPLEGSGHRQ